MGFMPCGTRGCTEGVLMSVAALRVVQLNLEFCCYFFVVNPLFFFNACCLNRTPQYFSVKNICFLQGYETTLVDG